MEAQKKNETATLELVPQDAGGVEETLTVVKGMSAESEAREASKQDEKVLSGLKKRAVDALTAAEKAMGKYWELLVYIRDNQIPPPVVAAKLKEAGFQDSRVAEVKRVAFCSPQLFEQYRARSIGFRLALKSAREDVAGVKKKANTLPEAQRFKAELDKLLGDYIPAAGALPKWLRSVKMDVIGCEVVLTVKRSKENAS